MAGGLVCEAIDEVFGGEEVGWAGAILEEIGDGVVVLGVGEAAEGGGESEDGGWGRWWAREGC